MSPRIFLICLLLFFPFAGQAQSDLRQQFVVALGQVEAGNSEAEDYPGLKAYVLYPYLEAAALRRALRRSPGSYTDKRIRRFLDEHGETAYTRSLHVSWMRRLAKAGSWQSYLDYYPARSTEELECLAAQARINLESEGAGIVAESLWLTGGLRHKSCIPVFKWLESKGRLTQELIDARVRMAMEVGNLKLVRSLAAKQGGAKKKRTEHWLWAWRNPRDAISRLAASGDRQMDAEMLGQVFRRLATRDRPKAAAFYDQAMARSQADDTLKLQLAAFIGYRQILNREPEALSWFKRSGTVSLRQVESDWRIRSAIYAESWQDVLMWINALPATEQESPRWKYWLGRAHLAMGDREKALASFVDISGKRDYYGFLAADQISGQYGIVDRPVLVDSEIQAKLKVREDARRAFELWKIGMNDKARSEWNALLQSLSKDEQLQAGILADEWGWWSPAILSYGKAGYWDDLARRFPAPHRTIFTRETKRQGIERSWAYAITRSESMFAADAQSPVGALGLMQLMPATAKQVARQERMKWRGTAMLYEPAHNIRLGTRYLADMRKRFDGHIALATAAYNAGPHNVGKWQPARTLPADIWIEAVPFSATHNYLRHVLEFKATYEWRLTGQYTRLSDVLPPVRGR